MKIFKYVGIPLLLLIGIYCLLCVLGPKNLNVERSTVIEAPKTAIFNLVNDIQKWEKWSSWNLRDTAMIITYPGKTVGVGGNSAWVSETEGNGTQEIVESIPGERLKTKLIFEGFGDPSHSVFKFEDEGDKTKVSWAMETTELSFPLRGMMMLMGMKGDIASNYEESLSNLKTLVETRIREKTYDGYKINDIRLPEKHFIFNRQEVGMDQIQQFYATNLGSLFAKVQASGVEMDGMPCGLFYSFNEKNQTTDMAAAIPTKESLIIPDASSISLPAKRAIQVDYYGDYHHTDQAHDAIEEYLKDNGLFNDYPVIEEYVTDPTVVKNSEKWLTKVTYYVSD